MTRLESELLEAIMANTYIETLGEMTDVEKEAVSRATAEVAKKYIVKAIVELSDMNTERIDTNEWREKWLKENGAI